MRSGKGEFGPLENPPPPVAQVRLLLPKKSGTTHRFSLDVEREIPRTKGELDSSMRLLGDLHLHPEQLD